MFLVSDGSSAREDRIKQIADDDPPLAALLAVIHFEWTVRRAIIALGTSPNKEIRRLLERCHGHRAYKKLWEAEVDPKVHKRLPDVVGNWDDLLQSFKLRHRLVHGVSSCDPEYANKRVVWAIAASTNVRNFCAEHSVNLDERLPIRRRKKEELASFAQESTGA